MPLSDTQLAMYPTLSWVRQRNASTLARWSATRRGYAIPSEKPPPEDARRFILADRIPQQMDSYVQRTLWLFAAHPEVRDTPAFFSQFNTPEVEAELDAKNDHICNVIIDGFAFTDISDAQVDAWFIQHGFEVEHPAVPTIGPMQPR